MLPVDHRAVEKAQHSMEESVMFNHMCVFKCFDWDTNALYVTYMHYLFVLFVTVTQDIS